ncbi:hypothetical protein Droror1_Dr00009324 [Drosera rotundifolia]
MEIELEGEDGTKFKRPLSPQNPTTFGRRNGLQSNDPTVSRHHISFHLSSKSDSTRVSFEVIGKNPVWVKQQKGDDDGSPIRAYKRLEKGDLGVGDMVCVNGSESPVWFTVKERQEEESGVGFRERILDDDDDGDGLFEGELGLLESVDVSDIDPVREFGFLVIGHEFDSYGKQMIHDLKNFNWFLDDHKEDVGDDEDSENEKRGRRSKRKKAKRKHDHADDEDWISDTGDGELIGKARKVQRPDYHTRSKDHYKAHANSGIRKGSIRKNCTRFSTAKEDEEDETLGGFIVDTDEVEDADKTDVDEEDEEDEEEDFDDEEDDDDE